MGKKEGKKLADEDVAGSLVSTVVVAVVAVVVGVDTTGAVGVASASDGFSFTGSGSLSAKGVMIVNLPKQNSDVVNINGSGTIDLSPMSTSLYRGISLWQQRSSTNQIAVTGNGATRVSGTFYTQHGVLNVTGVQVGHLLLGDVRHLGGGYLEPFVFALRLLLRRDQLTAFFFL